MKRGRHNQFCIDMTLYFLILLVMHSHHPPVISPLYQSMIKYIEIFTSYQNR